MAHCANDCSCSSYLEVLGIDTSHLFVLARACVEFGDLSELASLVDLHGCGGTRQLVTSSEILAVEMDPEAGQDDLIELAGDGLPAAVAVLTGIPHLAHQVIGLQEFAYEVPGRTPLVLGSRDATLVAISCNQADGAVVVTDDEELLGWIGGANDGGLVDLRTEPSVSMLGKLHGCGALGDALLEASLTAEERYQSGRHDLPDWKLQAKLDRIDREISRLAVVDAQKRPGEGDDVR